MQASRLIPFIFIIACYCLEMSTASELFRKTPLIPSRPHPNVFFKLENLQPSGSFKDRGISNMIVELTKQGPVSKLICSSGGNAGHAVAVAGQALNIPVEVFVPSTTLPMMVRKLEAAQAKVTVAGKNWNEADAQARIALAANPEAKYIPPFDDPLIWQGHASLVDELAEQLPQPPDVIIASVGGGGLLRGLQLGLHKHQWYNTKILAVETEGAASFALAKRHGRAVALEAINTVASTLGALAVTPAVLDPALSTDSVVVTDTQAVQASLLYCEESRQLVEPSCGAALSLYYDTALFEQYLGQSQRAVVVVCGGSAVSLELLRVWGERFKLT